MISNFIQNKNETFIIFDIGSKDCIQSIEFYKQFPNSKIYVLVCNPSTIDVYKKNISKYSDRITLICDYNKEIKFYPINTFEDCNLESLSIFKSNENYVVQNEIITQCHRLDSIIDKYLIQRVDIIWMDLEGYELLKLKGLGNYLHNVKYIYTKIYSDQGMFKELNDFIVSFNFSIMNNLQTCQEYAIYKKDIELSKYEHRIFSQNGEDGITLEIINRLNIKNGFYVEFGTQNAEECNTRILREKYNWNGLLMDGSYENNNINLKKEFITRENIINLFVKYDVPNKFDLLSIDIDFNDFYVLHKILQNYQIDIIILEYNAYFYEDEDAIIKYDPTGSWDGSNYFGASLLSYYKLLNKFGYVLIYTEKKGVNAFFVKNENGTKFEFNNDINFLYNTAKYGNGPRGGHKNDNKFRKYVKYNDIIDLI
jgi:FkbM family methyltransferase